MTPEDPRKSTMSPKPEGPQQPPGLQSEMTVQPDYGESSYKGHGRLKDRAALITGRNHHSVATGVITEVATGYDGYTGVLPDQVPPLGQGVWAPFFGRPAYTMTLLPRLAQQTGARVFLGVCERLPRGIG